MSAAPDNPETIEREISQTRDRVEHTLEALRDRLSPREIFERTARTARAEVEGMARDLAASVRRNPLAWTFGALNVSLVLLLGAGERRPRRFGGGPLTRSADALAARPLLLSAVGLSLGILLGASLPAHPAERVLVRRAGARLARGARRAVDMGTAQWRAAQAAGSSMLGRGRTPSGGPAARSEVPQSAAVSAARARRPETPLTPASESSAGAAAATAGMAGEPASGAEGPPASGDTRVH